MPSLTGCMKKAGQYLDAEDRAAVVARVRELKGQGIEQVQASRQAVQERIDHVSAQPKELGQSNRAKITFLDGKKIISLFESKDPSSLAHESGHAWLEELMQDASAESAPQQLKDDMDTVRKWLGNDGGKLTEEQHEKFARGTETYLMEGKAPSSALARVFSRFKQWLTKLYQTVDRLNAPINDEVRAVFDRLLATDAEIESARQDTGLKPSFASREEAGMTKAEWNAYLRAIEKSTQQAESSLLDKMMARVRRQRERENTAERRAIEDEVKQQVDARPDIEALGYLRGTKIPGNPEGIRLSSAEIERLYGKEALESMPSGTTAKNGATPNEVAEMLGFESGEALVGALRELERQQRELRAKEGEKRTIRQYLIDQAVDERMAGKDELNEEQIREEAMAAVHSEGQAELMALELRYLRRRGAQAIIEQGKQRTEQGTKEPKSGASAEKSAEWNIETQQAQEKQLREAVAVSRAMLDGIRAHVDTILEGKTTAELRRYGDFLRAERKAAREVQQAILKKDWQAAADAKQRQMLANVLYSKARQAAKIVERGTANMDRMAAKKSHAGIDQEYTDQIHDLIGRFGFDSGRGEELLRGKPSTLEEFVSEKAKSGIEPAVDPALYTLPGKAVGELSFAEFKALDDAVRSLQALGRDEKTVYLDGKYVDKALVLNEMVTAIRSLGERMKSDYYDPSDAGKLAAAKERLFGVFRGVDASLVKPEALFDQIDKANPFGVMNRAIFKPLKDAQGREDRWHEAAAKEMKSAVRAAGGKAWAKRLNDSVPEDPALLNPETGRPMKLTRQRMLSMALNVGNEGNMTKLSDGYGWSAAAIKSFLNREMTKADWDFVQSVWDMFDSHKQDLDDLQRRVTGVGLEMVRAEAFSSPHGTYRGGYYPIVYDAGKSFKAEMHAEKATEAIFPNNYTRATTPKGSTIARVEGVKRPIQLSLNIAPWKIGQVLHDLAFREAIITADSLLSDNSVKKAFDDVFGSEYRKLLRPWLKHVANSRNIDDAAIGWMDKALSAARTNVVIVGIGFRLTTMFKHGFSALSNSFREVGPEWMLKGTKEFYNPSKIKENWAFITDKSSEMRFRLQAYDKDLSSHYRELVSNSSYSNFKKNAQWFGHVGVSMLDMGSAAPTWLGAYRKALASGKSDADAVYIADKTVRNAHGAQGITDTAAVQRAKGVASLVTMFYGFFNHIYNRQRTMFIQGAEGVKNWQAGEKGAAIKNFAEVLATSFWYIALPALVEAFATSGGPNENEEEGWGEWAAKAIAAEIPAGIPIVRDLAKAAIEGRDYEVSPIFRAVNDVLASGRDVTNYVQGEDVSENAGKHLATAFGYLTGLPTAAPFTAAKFLWDYNSGDADPESLKDWWQGITRGKVTHE